MASAAGRLSGWYQRISPGKELIDVDIEDIRPFTFAEFEGRMEQARRLMREQRLDAIVVSAEQNLYYFTGFYTQFFASPTRPWFFVLPLDGEPCAIVPELGVGPMSESTWVRNYRSWISPNPDDEGVSLVADCLRRCRRTFARVGFEIGPESRLGFPVQDFLRIRERIAPIEAGDCSALLRRLRSVKSAQEIARLYRVCQIVSDAFDAVPREFSPGDRERDVATRIRRRAFEAGVDRLPYLSFNSGQGGYRTAISDPGDHVLEPNDVFTMDVGCVVEGYHSDFNRNWSVGRATDEIRLAYEVLYRATDAGLAAVRPGARARDLFHAQLEVIVDALPRFRDPVTETNVAGRFGHGLGLYLTEPPSNSPHDDTVLAPGMVLTIEPAIFFSRTQMMLTEEDIVVTEDGYRMLSRRCPEELPVLPA
jgi:Xaa-Pro aminopeptidase